MGTDGTTGAGRPGPAGGTPPHRAEPASRAARDGAPGAPVLAGRYRLESPVGRGGMGVVWRATDLLLGREVAIKELSLEVAADAPGDEARVRRERTLREARALAQLGHPHIIGVHDVVESDGRPYIVMELVVGPSLAEHIARTGPVDPREAARIGIALLGALRKAHDSGVLHRDLKPANVLLESETGRVVLTDFGIAQLPGATTLTESGSFLGSPEYTAPERMAASRTGPESDLWSLGVLLCAAVSGHSPFHRDSLTAVLHAVVSDDIRVPPQAAPLLPVVRGLLERDPDRRLDAGTAERMLREYAETGHFPELPTDPAGGERSERTWRAPLAGRLPRLPHRAPRRGRARPRTAPGPAAEGGAQDAAHQPGAAPEPGQDADGQAGGPPDAPRGTVFGTHSGPADPRVARPRTPADHTFADRDRTPAAPHAVTGPRDHTTGAPAREPGARTEPDAPGHVPAPPDGSRAVRARGEQARGESRDPSGAGRSPAPAEQPPTALPPPPRTSPAAPEPGEPDH